MKRKKSNEKTGLQESPKKKLKSNLYSSPIIPPNMGTTFDLKKKGEIFYDKLGFPPENEYKNQDKKSPLKLNPDLENRSTLPYYLDYSNVFGQLKKIMVDEREPLLLTLIDNPGFGKTISSSIISENFDSFDGYFRIESGSNSLSEVDGNINRKLRKLKIHKIGKTEKYEFQEVKSCILQTYNDYFRKLINFIHLECEQGRKNIGDTFNYTKTYNSSIKPLDKYFILHIDEIQYYSIPNDVKITKDLYILKNEAHYYFLRYFTESINTFKNSKIRFIITGTNLNSEKYIRFSSKAKTQSIRLKQSGPSDIKKLLPLYFDLENYQIKNEVDKICETLSGCIRSFQYFVMNMYKSYQMNKRFDVDKSLDEAYVMWANDVAKIKSQYKDLYDELLLFYLYYNRMGGIYIKDGNYIKFPFAIPGNWIQHVKNGAMRAEIIIHGSSFRLYFPFPFMLKFMKSKLNTYLFENVESLYYELRASIIQPDIRKGFCFQRAVGLEMTNSRSPFMKYLLDIIKSKKNIALIPYIGKQINYYYNNKGIKKGMVNLAQEIKGRKYRKLGDICGKSYFRSDFSKDIYPISIFIEVKFMVREKENERINELIAGALKFFDRANDYMMSRNEGEEDSFFVFLTMNSFDLDSIKKPNGSKVAKNLIKLKEYCSKKYFQCISIPTTTNFHFLRNISSTTALRFPGFLKKYFPHLKRNYNCEFSNLKRSKIVYHTIVENSLEELVNELSRKTTKVICEIWDDKKSVVSLDMLLENPEKMYYMVSPLESGNLRIIVNHKFKCQVKTSDIEEFRKCISKALGVLIEDIEHIKNKKGIIINQDFQIEEFALDEKLTCVVKS